MDGRICAVQRELAALLIGCREIVRREERVDVVDTAAEVARCCRDIAAPERGPIRRRSRLPQQTVHCAGRPEVVRLAGEHRGQMGTGRVRVPHLRAQAADEQVQLQVIGRVRLQPLEAIQRLPLATAGRQLEDLPDEGVGMHGRARRGYVDGWGGPGL